MATESAIGASGLASVAVDPWPTLNVVFSAVPPSFLKMVSFLVGLVLVGRLSPSDSPLLLVILVFVDMFEFL